jgi:hypothetical protein
MAVPSVTNAQGQVSIIQMQWPPEAGAKLKGPLTKPTIVHISNNKKTKTKNKKHLLYSFFYTYINNVNSYMYTNDVLLVTSAHEPLNNIQMQRSPRADA